MSKLESNTASTQSGSAVAPHPGVDSMPRWAVGGNSRSMVCAVAGLALKASTAATTNADALAITNFLSKKVAGKGRQRFMVFIQRLRVMGTFIVNQ